MYVQHVYDVCDKCSKVANSCQQEADYILCQLLDTDHICDIMLMPLHMLATPLDTDHICDIMLMPLHMLATPKSGVNNVSILCHSSEQGNCN